MQTSMMFAFVTILHILASAHLGADSLSITTQGYELTKDLGTELLMPCEVSGSFSPFDHQIIWYKTDKDGNNIQLNTMSLINSPFKESERYSVEFDNKLQEVDPTISLPLTITEVHLADNGTFTCELLDGSGVITSIQHSVLVPAPIDVHTLYTNDTRIDADNKTTFDFAALRPTYVSCKSVGGHPQPTVRMFRGDFDITNEFEEKIEEKVTGEKGLEETTYEIELVTKEFRAEMDDQGKQLKCVARIHRMHEFKKTQTGVMEVTYPPSFDCETHAYAFTGTENFTIDCKVRGNPEVHVDSIFWIVGENNGTNITVNATHPGFTVNITEDKADHAVHVSLTISLVNETSYRGYLLRAKNSVGESHHEVILNEATTTQPTTTTKKPKTKPTKKPKNPDNKPNPGAVGGDDENGTGAVQCSVSFLVMILVTGALSW